MTLTITLNSLGIAGLIGFIIGLAWLLALLFKFDTQDDLNEDEVEDNEVCLETQLATPEKLAYAYYELAPDAEDEYDGFRLWLVHRDGTCALAGTFDHCYESWVMLAQAGIPTYPDKLHIPTSQTLR